MKKLWFPLLLAALIASAAACGGGGSKEQASATTSQQAARTCPAAWRADWQKLADTIQAAVYCPSWLPDPLTGVFGGPWNNINSVDKKDRSYLLGFAWQERGEEIHINFRGYPGVTKVPTCRSIELVGGKKHEKTIPCFSDRGGTKRTGDIEATVYTVNQDADQWHVLYAWTHDGSLYTLSEHVSPPLTYPQVIRNLDRMLRSLVLLQPSS